MKVDRGVFGPDAETLATIETVEGLLAEAPPIHEQVPAEIRAARWEAAGNAAELAVCPGGIHGFNLFPNALGKRALAHAEGFLAAAFRSDD